MRCKACNRTIEKGALFRKFGEHVIQEDLCKICRSELEVTSSPGYSLGHAHEQVLKDSKVFFD